MINNDLKQLRTYFQNENFDIRICGGACRDYILGLEPNDIDICTNANPEQQIEIYKKNDVRYFETGIKHGTIMVVLNHVPYEITSLRIDTNQDGRWADVQFINDWYLDSSRRDFTFNAISMTFDGKIVDPFDGKKDLLNNIVRFVGNPNDRIQEDYLRILRFYRFNARFGKKHVLKITENALINNAAGLKQISRERVWAEMKKIFAHDKVIDTLVLMQKHGIFKYIDFRDDVSFHHLAYFKKLTNNPVVRLVMFTGSMGANSPGFDYIACDWKLSNEEAYLGKFVLKYWDTITIKKAKEMLTEKVNKEVIFETLKAAKLYKPTIETWNVPAFPINGAELMPRYSGKELGEEIKKLRQMWYDFNFSEKKLRQNFNLLYK
jgi:tRNA nucleotidyltransferase/poly(A) polymerase